MRNPQRKTNSNFLAFYETRIRCRSITFVPVDPVVIKSPSSSKSGYASWSRRASAAFAFARATVVPSAMAPSRIGRTIRTVRARAGDENVL